MKLNNHSIADDIKRLRELAEKATPVDYAVYPNTAIHERNRAFIAASRTAIPMLCDALEQELKDGEEMQSTITNLNVAYDTLCEENRDLRVKLSAQTVLANHAQVFQDLALQEEIEKLTARAASVEARLEKCTTDLHEARAQQAHTASCNLELMRKLDKALSTGRR